LFVIINPKIVTFVYMNGKTLGLVIH
jgi:hypothetical protein